MHLGSFNSEEALGEPGSGTAAAMAAAAIAAGTVVHGWAGGGGLLSPTDVVVEW